MKETRYKQLLSSLRHQLSTSKWLLLRVPGKIEPLRLVYRCRLVWYCSLFSFLLLYVIGVALQDSSTRSKSQENITYLESCLQNGHWKRGIRFGTQPHAKVRVDHCFWMRNSVKKYMDEKVEGKHEVPIHLKTIINSLVNF